MQSKLILLLLLIVCFSLATGLEHKRESAPGNLRSEGFLALILGEGRMLFANEVFAKADVYFHRGRYPTIFETGGRPKENHMSGAARAGSAEEHHHAPGESHEHHDHEGHDHHDHANASHDDNPGRDHDHEHDGDAHAEEHDHADAIAPATDWIARFREKFHAAEHVHLEKGAEREMLPWLRLSAELNPQNIEAYTVSAYWLRTRLNKVDDAERFLREGLRNNPGNPELLSELGWLKLESRKDFAGARNLLLSAMERWGETERLKERPNEFLAERILGGLFKLELESNRIDAAIYYLEQMKRFSHVDEGIDRRIEELRQRLPPE